MALKKDALNDLYNVMFLLLAIIDLVLLQIFIQRNTHCSSCNAGALVSNTEQEPVSLLGHNITQMHHH